MLFPNKLITYNESVISKIPMILEIIERGPIGIKDLYHRVAPKLTGVNEYMDVLDCLYALGAIDLDTDRGVLVYVNRNTV